jgi:fermentation-respiration switch protein FrsA (DUF1100 family)
LLAVAILTYLSVCLVVMFLQGKLIYFPTRGYDATPTDAGLVFEDLRIATKDGVKIAAWYVPHEQARGLVIFCHGNAGNIADRLHTIKELHRLRLNVLIFDYRGYGESEGKPTERGTYADAEAAWRYLTETRGEPAERIVIFGRSLGGAVAIELASRHTPAALIVELSFTSIADVGKLHYPLLPVRWLVTYRYASIEKVPNLTCRKLFLHGKDDELIPLTIGRALFDAAAEPRQFIETPGGHNAGGFLYSPAQTAKLAEFMDEILR